jgi:trehalose synthase-fused probable maltokinase
VLALVDVRGREENAPTERYVVPFVGRGGAAREAVPGDGAWRALAAAIAGGRTIPAMGRAGGEAAGGGEASGQVDAALVCRPAPGFEAAWDGSAVDVARADEAPPGNEASNAAAIIGGRLRLKAYRRIEPGLNPDLELTAYLSEEAAFPGVARLAGWAEVVTRESGAATVAMLQAFVPGAEAVDDRVEEFLVGLVAAPGSVSMEWATEVAADLGTLVGGLHAALATPPADAPDLAPRPATHDELRAWRMDAHRGLNRAIEAAAALDPAVASDLRRWASGIAARVSRFEAVVATPTVMRIHGNLHLGELLVADDGYRVVDFEGPPGRPLAERRRPDSPLRDVATVLRSLDRVARRAARRAAGEEDGGPAGRGGLDIEAWIARGRERFLEAYSAARRQAGTPVELDPDLLDAFEVAASVAGVAWAAVEAPERLWTPYAGLRWLAGRGETG